jgi:hypothetical protein
MAEVLAITPSRAGLKRASSVILSSVSPSLGIALSIKR